MKHKKKTLKKIIRDNRTRSVLKAISYRVLSLAVTFIISYLVTHNLQMSFTIGGFDALSKILFYYFHERIWHYSTIGRKRKNTRFTLHITY